MIAKPPKPARLDTIV